MNPKNKPRGEPSGDDVAQQAGSFNHYVCEKCGQRTIAKHDDPGVTPFMLGCRATPNCDGTGYSQFYRVSQDPKQDPHVVWFRAPNAAALEHAIRAMDEDNKTWAREHHNNGGCLLRETKRSARYNETKAGIMLTSEQKAEHLESLAAIRKIIAEGDVSTGVILLLNLCEKLLEQLGPSEHAQRVNEAMRQEKP